MMRVTDCVMWSAKWSLHLWLEQLEKGWEDAYFISEYGGGALRVADGVSGRDRVLHHLLAGKILASEVVFLEVFIDSWYQYCLLQLQEHGGDGSGSYLRTLPDSFRLFFGSRIWKLAVDDGRKLSGKESGSTYYLVAAENIMSSFVSIFLYTQTAIGMYACPTDLSTVSFANVKSACPLNAVSPSDACCTAYRTAACQYSDQVNDFNSICPIPFINYLSAVGPYPAGYFVGNCVSGSSGLCSRS
ncbi:unnamed protein product [Sphagnum troendelagicum]